MCNNDRLRVLKSRIAEVAGKIAFDGQDELTDLVEELQTLCPHIEKKLYDDELYICTCCDKLFVYKRA